MKNVNATSERGWRMADYAVMAAWAAFFTFSIVSANTGPAKPDDLVRSVSAEVLQIARSERDSGASERERVESLIERKIAPHFDFTRITRLAVGPAWREATTDQRDRLTAAFRGMLIRTYAAAYRGYRDVTIDVKPAALDDSDKDVIVRTTVKVPENPSPLPIDYSMYRSSDGWKVYDVAVAGVSLVTTYRSGFREKMNAKGIEGLITDLQKTTEPPAAPRRP